MDSDELATNLAEIKTNVAWIREALAKLATCERVDALAGRMDRHIESHERKGPKAAQWIAIAVAAVLGALGIVSK